jgi:hypothetical protein
VLVCITRACCGTLDGVHLGDFDVGHTYDVSTTIATYLVVEQFAEPVSEPFARTAELTERREFSGNWRDWAVAADSKKG